MKIALFIANLFKRPVHLFVFIFIFFPLIAYAGFFSFMTSVFKDSEPGTIDQNSQNIALLQGNISPTSGPVGGGDIAIVNNSALLPENSGFSQNDREHTNDQISIYVVRSGDTLSGIAKMFNVTVNTIIWTNDIKGGKVKPGDELVILPISGVRHTVKSGDTLQSIARKYNGDIEEIGAYNEISSNTKLAVGDIVIIPDGEITVSHEPTPVKAGSKTSSKKTPDYSKSPSYSGYYLRPLVGGIKTQGIHGYNGVDIAGTFGTNILASASGEVIIAK